jgi:hypothetical protein
VCTGCPEGEGGGRGGSPQQQQPPREQGSIVPLSDKLLCAAGAPLIAAAISEGKTLYVGLGAAAGVGGGLGISGSVQIQLYATPHGTVGIVVTIGYNPNLLPNVGVSANAGVAISISSNPPTGQTRSGSMSASSGPILVGGGRFLQETTDWK